MFLGRADFYYASAFIEGYGLGSARRGSAVLDGWREWLIARRGRDCNHAWPGQVLHIALPAGWENLWELPPEDEAHAIKTLFQLLDEFLTLDESTYVGGMTSHRWHLQGSADRAYSGEEARLLLGNRLGWASQETWFEDEHGRLLAVVTNGERAMVMLLDGEGDPGEHLVDPRGQGRSDGYLLSNGQVDTYDDRDTVAFDVAGHAVAHLIDHGIWPDDVIVEDDRGG